MRTLDVITFAGGSAAPIYVAQAKGFFEREGLIVRDTATPSSGYQMASLVAGKFHIAGTALDNLIAYQEGQGTAPLDRAPDLVTLMGLSSTELALMAQPAITRVEDLRGKQFALDSLSTGYAFVLRAMLDKHGLAPGDYEFVAVGGTRERLEALKDERMAAALITEPFTTQAKRAGFSYLGEAVDSVGAYQASVQIANRTWALENEDAVVGYLRAMLAAIDFIYDSTNTAEVAKIIAAKIGVPDVVALLTSQGLTRGRTALARKGEIDMEGLRNVIALRERFAEPGKPLEGPEKYYDPRWWRKAVAG